MVNKAIVLGYLGGDPEFYAKDGKSWTSFSVATSERWRDKATGERKERTDWHRVVVFNERLVDTVRKFLKRGSRVYVEGQMSTRKWKDKSGADKQITEIILRGFSGQLQLMDKSSGGVPAPGGEDEYGVQSGGGSYGGHGGNAQAPVDNDFDGYTGFY